MKIVPRYVPQSGNMKMAENGNYVSASDYDKCARVSAKLLDLLPHILNTVESGKQSAEAALATIRTFITIELAD